MFKIKVAIGLSMVLVLIFTGCVVQTDVSNNKIISTENRSSKELCDYCCAPLSLTYN